MRYVGGRTMGVRGVSACVTPKLTSKIKTANVENVSITGRLTEVQLSFQRKSMKRMKSTE